MYLILQFFFKNVQNLTGKSKKYSIPGYQFFFLVFSIGCSVLETTTIVIQFRLAPE